MKKIFTVLLFFISLASFSQEPLKWGQTVGLKINDKADSIKLNAYTFALSYNDAINVIEHVAPKYGKGIKQSATDKNAFSILNEYFEANDTLRTVEIEVSRDVALKVIGSPNQNVTLASLQKKQADLEKEFADFYAKEYLKEQAMSQEEKRRISSKNSIIIK